MSCTAAQQVVNQSSADVPRLNGNSLHLGLQWLRNPYALLDHAQRTVGLNFRATLPVLGKALFIGEPDLLLAIANSRDFDAGTPIDALRALLGPRSLIMVHGEEHAARRQRVAQLFLGSAADNCESWMIELARREVQSLDRNRPFSAYHLVQRIALRAILAAMFGRDVAEQGQAERLVRRFLQSFRSPLILFLKPLRINLGPLSPWGRAVRNRQQLCAFIRQQLDLERCRNGHTTMLGRLMAYQGKNDAIDDEDIVEEILALLLFGHDTGAATMAWAFAHILNDPAIVDAAEQEASDWCRRGSRDPEELIWLQACLRESMRLRPVVVHLGRRAIRDTQLGAIRVSPGELIIPCTYLAQHNPAVFPQPDAFRPERFLSGRRYVGSYFPYGFGNRTCVGKPFVARQMPLLIATVLAAGPLRLVPGYQLRPKRQMVLMVPSDGTLVEFRKKTPTICLSSEYLP